MLPGDREAVSAAVDTVEVASDVERWRLQVPVRVEQVLLVRQKVFGFSAPSRIEVEVFGEHHGRQADRERAFAHEGSCAQRRPTLGRRCPRTIRCGHDHRREGEKARELL